MLSALHHPCSLNSQGKSFCYVIHNYNNTLIIMMMMVMSLIVIMIIIIMTLTRVLYYNNTEMNLSGGLP